jgi:protein arginine kinase activator
MQYKCDKCGKLAAVHLTEIVDNQKIEKHLCDECAVAEGIASKINVPISQLLEEFILHGNTRETKEDAKCEVCGLTFAEFRKQQTLGCPNDYDAFADLLTPLIERAQEGASHHVGKAPQSAGQAQRRQNTILRLRAALRGAIAAEDYEQAARIRDQIKECENQ